MKVIITHLSKLHKYIDHTEIVTGSKCVFGSVEKVVPALP